MGKIENAVCGLKERGFNVTCFKTKEEAAKYLNESIDGKSVGFGGSVTLKEMGLYELLKTHNEVHWHWEGGQEERMAAKDAQVYITSANGLSEGGEIINIDGAGNRVASTLFGHEKVYFVIGENKIEPDYEKALYRARNVSAPKNAKRLNVQTPCAKEGNRCYDCKSPGRICRGLTVLWGPMLGMESEIILVEESLGF